MANYRGVYF